MSLSSAEAELYSLLKGAAEAFGLLAIGRDLGIHFEAMVHTDAAEALCIIQRQGFGAANIDSISRSKGRTI